MNVRGSVVATDRRVPAGYLPQQAPGDKGCPLIGPRAALTRRAMAWATDALAHDDTTVSALARHLRVDWHTLWHAVRAEATARLAEPRRLVGVDTLGVDEHIWRPGTAVPARRSLRWSI